MPSDVRLLCAYTAYTTTEPEIRVRFDCVYMLCGHCGKVQLFCRMHRRVQGANTPVAATLTLTLTVAATPTLTVASTRTTRTTTTDTTNTTNTNTTTADNNNNSNNSHNDTSPYRT